MLLPLLIVFVILLAYWYSHVRRYPRGPFPLPLLGNLLSLDSAKLEWQLLEWRKIYGPIYTVWMPYPVVIFGDDQVIKTHFIKNGEAFAGRPSTFAMEVLCGGNYGLAFNENSMYKEQRRFALHVLRDLGLGKDVMERAMIELARRSTEKIREANGEPIELKPYVVSAVSNVINQLVFGEIREHDDPEVLWLKKQVDEAFESFFHPLVMAADAIPWLRHLEPLFPYLGGGFKMLIDSNRICMDYMQKEIDKRKAVLDLEAEPTCYVDAFLIEMRKREKEGNVEHYTPIQLLAAVFDLYAAGMETTITTLRFAFHYLLNKPQVQEKIHKELDEVVGEKEIHLEDARRMPYLNATLQELQRVVNILPMNLTHALMEEVTVNGCILPVGTAVVAQIQCVHLDEELYPRPELFIPERHLNEKGEFVKDEKINPFSVGKRSCLGEALARGELLLFFSTFLQHFRIESVGVIPPKLECQATAFRTPKAFQCRMIPRR